MTTEVEYYIIGIRQGENLVYLKSIYIYKDSSHLTKSYVRITKNILQARKLKRLELAKRYKILATGFFNIDDLRPKDKIAEEITVEILKVTSRIEAVE